MRQTLLTVAIEVQPASADRLRGCIRQLQSDEQTVSAAFPGPYDRMKTSVPLLHFMSMMVFEDDQYDPLFVLEANFDGAPGPFWAQLEAVIGPELRAMLRCCKQPRDASGALFAAITAPGSRQPLAPFLEACTVFPAAKHQGNRGRTREQILREAALFRAVQAELEDPARFRDDDAAGIHRTLRAALLPRFPVARNAGRPRGFRPPSARPTGCASACSRSSPCSCSPRPL